MTLREAIEQYVLWRQAHGAKFTTGANLLRSFLGHADGDAACDAVTTAQVLAFLAGEGPLTRHRENKYYALAGFWRHAISRGHARRSPLPNDEPKSPFRTPPYIYSRDELQRLLDPATVASSRRGAVQLDAVTFRTLLLLFTGRGCASARRPASPWPTSTWRNAVLTIRATKFYKSRLVPIGPQLAAVLETTCLCGRRERACAGRTRSSWRTGTARGSPAAPFRPHSMRCGASPASARRGGRTAVPRLHDLRHSFAVHSLTGWYRQGADVQRLLPVLSTYLGHSDLEGTKVYLSMTPELLEQASLRFARYAGRGQHG